MDSESSDLPIVGISACLLGRPVRYDGGSKLHLEILEYFHNKVRWMAICPETECGMDTPRAPMHLQGDVYNPSLVVSYTGTDMTGKFNQWLSVKFNGKCLENLSGMVLKSKSPSCAIRNVPVFTDESRSEVATMGPGLFSRAFAAEYPTVPTVAESDLNTIEAMDEFYGRILERRSNLAT